MARAAVKRSIDGLTSVEKTAARAATAIERTFQRAGAASAAAATKVAAADAQVATRRVAAAKTTADKLSSLEDGYFKRDYDRRSRFEARKQTLAERTAGQLAAVEDRHSMRDYTRRVAHEARKQKEADRATSRAIAGKEREAAKLSKIEDRYLMREYRERIAYQQRQEQDAEASARRREQSLLRGAQVVTATALLGLKILNDGYQKIREDAEAAADATIKLRKNLQVESTLKGAERTDNRRLQESLLFRAQTGLDEQGAGDFTRQYLGSVPVGFQKGNITEATSKDLMVQAGVMAARQGGDKGTRGELAGLLGQFGKVRSAEQGMAQLEAIRVALTEGRGDDTPLTRQLLDAAGSMVREGGPVPDLTEMAVLTGVTSLTNPNEAATGAKRINRFLMETQGKGAKFLKKSGIEEGMSIEQKLDVLAPIVKEAQAQGRDAQTFLAESVGGGNNEEIASVVAVLRDYEVFKKRLAMARGAAGRGGAVREANERFLESPEGRASVGENLQAASQAALGLQGERFKALMTEAEASPEVQEGDQSIGTKLSDRFWGYMSGSFTDPEKEGRQQRVTGVAFEKLIDRARKLGVTDDELAEARHRSYRAGSANYIPEYVNQVEALISARGGSVAADIKPAMDRLAVAIEENNRLMKERGANGRGQAPVWIPPQGQPQGNRRP